MGAIVPLVLSGLKLIMTNLPAFTALGIDLVEVFDRSKAIVTGDTTSTPAEREAALAEIVSMEAQRDARLEELRLLAPNS